MSTDNSNMNESVNFEKMDIDELEQFIKTHPYEQNRKNLHVWYIYAYRLLNGTECPKNTSKALDYFEETASEYTLAALQAGQCYYNGIGTSPDLKEALTYFKRVSNVLGSISKEGYLWEGKCLLKMKKEQKAVECFKRVMEGVKTPKGIVHAKSAIEKEAKCLLGMCHYYGIGVEENKEIAFQYFKEASLGEGASLAAQYYLAHCYQKGIGTEVNPERAEHWRSECFEKNYEQIVNEVKELLGVENK